MSPIKHILVVVDPTGGERQAAVDKALILAQCFHASVELLICDIPPDKGNPLLCLSDEMEAIVPSVPPEDLLDRLAVPLRAQGLEVTVRTVLGKCLHTAILDYLHASNATLMIKDTHHHSLPRRTFLKNTDWCLAHGSTVPLLLTKNMVWARPPRIMAAIDRRPNKTDVALLDRKILRSATALASGLSAELEVIYAYVPEALAAAVSSGLPPDTADVARDLECEISYIHGQVESFARTYGVQPSRLHVEMGTPTRQLIDSAKQYGIDILVIGASSHGRWHRTVIGSTASAVLELLPCDLLVVRADDSTRHE
jgi:universal stress protein E